MIPTVSSVPIRIDPMSAAQGGPGPPWSAEHRPGGPGQRPPETGEHRAEGEDEREEGRHVDPEGIRHLAVGGGRPDDLPRPRPVEEVPEHQRHGGRQHQHHEGVDRHGAAEDGHRPGDRVGFRDRLVFRPEDDLGQVVDDEDQGIRQEQLVDLLLPVDAAQEAHLDRRRDQGDPQRRHQERDQEPRGTGQVDRHGIDEVRPEHVERAVGEVQDVQDAEDQRESGGDQEEERRLPQGAQDLDREERQIDGCGHSATGSLRVE
jgi:hypothetical protein